MVSRADQLGGEALTPSRRTPTRGRSTSHDLAKEDTAKALRIEIVSDDDPFSPLTRPWRRELVPRLDRAATTQLLAIVGSARKGDVLLVEYEPGKGTTIRGNTLTAVSRAPHGLMVAFWISGSASGRCRRTETPAAGIAPQDDAPMILTFEDRSSDSPFVEKIWRSRSDRGGPFVSIAQSHFEMAVTRHQGRTFITLRGPETQATRGDCPPDGEWLGIRFRLGTFMPRLIPGELRDRNDVTLPDATRRSFWLNGSACDYPDFENADTFVDRLVRKGLIVRDPVVDTVLRGGADARSIRSAQRHFLRATGISHGTVRQIERARRATLLLRDGVPILDVVHAVGYYDQAHLTRSLRHRIGLTPLAVSRTAEQLSFLYKTPPWP